MWTKARIQQLERLNARHLTYSEIAHRMGISRNAVAGALYRNGMRGDSDWARMCRSYSVGAMG